MRRHPPDGWRSVHAWTVDGAIESDERARLTRALVPATDVGARMLGDRYWAAVQRSTFGLVRLRAAEEGSVLHVLGLVLLRFGPTELEARPDGICCRFPIRGGLLARRPGGAFVLSQSTGTKPELRAAIAGFVPRLGARPYDGIQRRFHVRISRRFFVSLLAEEPA